VFCRDSCAASESVFGEALPNGLQKRLRRGSGRKSRSLAQLHRVGAAKTQLSPLLPQLRPRTEGVEEAAAE
jgi:hypothetical protein